MAQTKQAAKTPSYLEQQRDYEARVKAVELALATPELLLGVQGGVLPVAANYYAFLKGITATTDTNAKS